MRTKCNFSNFFNRIDKEIRLICLRKSLIWGAVFLSLGVFIWILSSDYGSVVHFWSTPKCAFPLFLMYFLWGCSFFFIGALLCSCVCGIEKFRRRLIYKDILMLFIMQIFSYIAYPLFFGACAPFLAFLSLLIASVACFVVLISIARYFSIWTIALGIHFAWLLYNAYVAISFSIIN